MAKKTNPNVVPSAVVTPPVEELPAEADTTYRTYPTYPTDVTDAAPPWVEAQVLVKIMAGLTRPQALEVLAQQAAHDQTQKL